MAVFSWIPEYKVTRFKDVSSACRESRKDCWKGAVMERTVAGL